ncbi:MAG: zinc ribbon domain-containing protein [Planctomycetota bacterium]
MSVNCPNCDRVVGDEEYRCHGCGYGVRPKPHPGKRRSRAPGFLFDKGAKGEDGPNNSFLERELPCLRCGSVGHDIDSGSTERWGDFVALDFLPAQFVLVICQFCGHTEFFHARILRETGAIEGRKRTTLLRRRNP